MKNYFEHEVKVKFFDGILEHSGEWQWFINYIEKEFREMVLNYKLLLIYYLL